MQVLSVWDELESRDYGWRGLPRYALGASSGGAMALVLAQVFPLQVGSDSPSRVVLHGVCAHPPGSHCWPSLGAQCASGRAAAAHRALCTYCNSLPSRSSLSTGLVSWVVSLQIGLCDGKQASPNEVGHPAVRV